MIGSPASRGATASVACAGRAGFAAAGPASAVSAAIAASITMEEGPQRRVATVDCAVVNRFPMPAPVEMPVRARVGHVSDYDIRINQNLFRSDGPGTDAATILAANPLPGGTACRWQNVSYT